MFDLNRNSLTKFGLVVTFFVFTAACAHNSVAPANNDSGSNNGVPDVTPQPYSAGQPTQKTATVAKPYKAKKFAKYKKSQKRSHVVAQHKKPYVAVTGTINSTPPAPPAAPPAPTPEITADHPVIGLPSHADTPPVYEGFWEKFEDYLSYTLMAIGAVGIVLIASRLERKRVKGRRKIVFN